MMLTPFAFSCSNFKVPSHHSAVPARTCQQVATNLSILSSLLQLVELRPRLHGTGSAWSRYHIE